MRNLIRDSFSSGFKGLVPKLAMIFVPLVIALFGLLFVSTFIDPFAQMENLPVAVINQDIGCEVNGVYENYGDELMKSVLENSSVKWTEETVELKNDGLENTDYYMAIIIPEDFSIKVAAGQTSEPTQANITFYKNVRKNFTLAMLSTRVESGIKETVNQKIGEQYTRELVNGLFSAKDGFEDAATGGDELAEGANELSDALSSAHEGSIKLTDGINDLGSAANRLATGTSALSTGTQTLNAKVGELPSSVDQLSKGIASVSVGVTAAKDGTTSLSDGTSKVKTGLLGLKTANTQASGLVTSAATEIQNIAGASQSAATLSGDAVADIQTAINLLNSDPTNLAGFQLLARAQQEAAGAQAYAQNAAIGLYSTNPEDITVYAAVTGIGQYTAGIDASLGTAADSVDAGTLIGAVNGLNSGLVGLESGLKKADDALIQISQGMTKLATQSGILSNAVSELNAGAVELNDKIPTFQSGVIGLESGADKLTGAIGEIKEGATSVADGAVELQEGLADGAKSIEESVTANSDDYAAYIAEPVAVEEDAYGDLEFFGFGFAPFFMTTALWLGTLVIFFVFGPFPSRKMLGANRFQIIFGRWPLYMLLMLCELAAIVLFSFIVGIPYKELTAYLLMFLVIGFTFTCIMQCLNLFDLIGKALVIIILIIQIVCSSGTFPVVLGSGFARIIHPWLPFTYAVDGFREIMSGNHLDVAYKDMGCLLLFAAAAICLSLLLYPVAKKLKIARDKRALEELIQ